MRSILFNLIEETARHAGHADIIRVALDGALSDSDGSHGRTACGRMGETLATPELKVPYMS